MVDLRWGLKGEMNDNDPDRQLYSTELDECLRTSAGPNFVVRCLFYNFTSQNLKPEAQWT